MRQNTSIVFLCLLFCKAQNSSGAVGSGYINPGRKSRQRKAGWIARRVEQAAALHVVDSQATHSGTRYRYHLCRAIPSHRRSRYFFYTGRYIVICAIYHLGIRNILLAVIVIVITCAFLYIAVGIIRIFCTIALYEFAQAIHCLIDCLFGRIAVLIHNNRLLHDISGL